MGIAYGYMYFTLATLFVKFFFNDTKRSFFLFACSALLIELVFFKDNFKSTSILISIIIAHYFLMRKNNKSRFFFIFSYFLPVGLLIFYKLPSIVPMLGVSYIAFRMLSALMELKDEKVEFPQLYDYLSYCLYFPTFKVGPIGSLNDYVVSIKKRILWTDIEWGCSLRVLYGTVKITFLLIHLGSFADTFGYNTWDEVENFKGLVLTGYFSYLKMYLSFSGLCDIAIGISGFLGIDIKENFSEPFRARNISQFWSSWHISLTDLLKDLIFYPLNMFLLRRFGRQKSKYITPLVLCVLFITIGLWHGFASNFLALGLYHSAGAVIQFYYSLVVVRRIQGYNENKFFEYMSIVLTQIFVSISFLIFDNSLQKVEEVLSKVFS